MNDVERRLAKLEAELEVAKRQLISVRRSLHQQSEWIDTHNTPLWKRIWFVAQGYRFRRLGVWYKAPWNKSGWEY